MCGGGEAVFEINVVLAPGLACTTVGATVLAPLVDGAVTSCSSAPMRSQAALDGAPVSVPMAALLAFGTVLALLARARRSSAGSAR